MPEATHLLLYSLAILIMVVAEALSFPDNDLGEDFPIPYRILFL
jgi:hypothetical protein